MDDSGQLSQFAPLSTRRGRHGSRGGGCSRASYVEPRQSGSTEDLGLPRCLACSHARSQWSDCAGWALAERGWLGACHGCVDTLGCSSRTAESAAMVASPCRSEPSGTSIGDGPNPPSASWEMGIGLWQRASQSLMHVFWEAEGRTNRLVRSDHGDGRPGPDRPAAPCLGWRQRWHQLSAMAANRPSTLSLLLRRL